MMGGALFGAVPASDAAAALSGTGVTQGQAGALVGIVGGTFGTQGVSSICSLILAIIIMWLANNIKREAGK